jgi:hypothetical protein
MMTGNQYVRPVGCQGYVWVVIRTGANVVFDWRLSRRHGELTTLLEGFKAGITEPASNARQHG